MYLLIFKILLYIYDKIGDSAIVFFANLYRPLATFFADLQFKAV